MNSSSINLLHTHSTLRSLSLFSDSSLLRFQSLYSNFFLLRFQNLSSDFSLCPPIISLSFIVFMFFKKCRDIFRTAITIASSAMMGDISRKMACDPIIETHTTGASSYPAVADAVINLKHSHIRKLTNVINNNKARHQASSFLSELKQRLLLPQNEAVQILMAICGSVWKNVDGQLSFLRYAVSAPADMYTFAHSTSQLTYADALTRHELPIEQENKAWLSLELLEVLCQLAERGHVNSVRQMLQFPLMHCPTMLLLGMAQINTAYNLIQCKVWSTVFPMIAAKCLGSVVILQLWHLNPQLVLRGFIDMIRTDKGDMARILDICQEVKILSSLLDQIPFAFSIRLAAFSSQKGFLNLEKWLNHNLSTYKDVLFEECLKFVKEVPVVAADNVLDNSFQHSGALLNLYADTSETFLKVLQDYSEQIASKQLFEELKELHRASKQVSPRLQNVGDSDLSTSDDVNDIEAEANCYLHQIFSGPSTVELMIPMLVSFKDSSDKRERSNFECMIQNLFEEYQFFPKYPEKQLTIAAILLGSLVKHQLLTHVTLGFALDGVLDALCKPTESRLFAFGIRALKLFLDRLAEWTQYWNHILQISHLRGAHPELVDFIESLLARSSQGQLEANIGNGAAAADPQAGATSAALENVEEITQEQITRVLLERLIFSRPHPYTLH